MCLSFPVSAHMAVSHCDQMGAKMRWCKSCAMVSDEEGSPAKPELQQTNYEALITIPPQIGDTYLSHTTHIYPTRRWNKRRRLNLGMNLAIRAFVRFGRLPLLECSVGPSLKQTQRPAAKDHPLERKSTKNTRHTQNTHPIHGA